MNFSEWFRMLWGLSMGTSVHYIKPSKRYLWPTKWHRVDSGFSLFLGGSGNCGVVESESEIWLVNANSGKGAEALKAQLPKGKILKGIILTSRNADFSQGIQLLNPEKIYISKNNQNFFKLPEGAPEIVWLEEEKIIQVGEETMTLVPVDPAFTNGDLYVGLAKRAYLLCGGLFFNKVHPPFAMSDGVDFKGWVRQLEKLLQAYPECTWVPHEGDTGSKQDACIFLNYLVDLQNPECEFSYCRENYDWMEIPSFTSLEENFDLVRKNIKNFVSL